MKKIKKIEWIAYLSFFLACLVVGLVFLGLGEWRGSLFILLPLPFTFALYLTFFLTLRGKKAIGLALFTMLRILLVLVTLATPPVLWYFVPSIHENVTAFFLIAPPVEVLGVYILFLLFVFLGRKTKEKTRP